MRRSRWCSRLRVASTSTSCVVGDAGSSSAAAKPSAEDAAYERERIFTDRHAAPARATQNAALIDVERDEVDVAPARDAVVELGPQAFEIEHLPEERGHDDDRRLRSQRAQRAEQHLVEPL